MTHHYDSSLYMSRILTSPLDNNNCLAGTTVDRADPTQAEDLGTRMYGYAIFLSGYPFGFERL